MPFFYECAVVCIHFLWHIFIFFSEAGNFSFLMYFDVFAMHVSWHLNLPSLEAGARSRFGLARSLHTYFQLA